MLTFTSAPDNNRELTRMHRFQFLTIRNGNENLSYETTNFRLEQVFTAVYRPYHNTSPTGISLTCKNVRDPEKIRFYELDHESKMRLLKTPSLTSTGLAMDPINAKQAIERSADLTTRPTTNRNLPYAACATGKAETNNALQQSKP